MTVISNFHPFDKYDYSMQCVVPENIQIPTTEGISNRLPPPLKIFHLHEEICQPPVTKAK